MQTVQGRARGRDARRIGAISRRTARQSGSIATQNALRMALTPPQSRCGAQKATRRLFNPGKVC